MKRYSIFLLMLMLLFSVAATATVYSSGTINLAIPDNISTGVSSTISVPDAGDVSAVKVGLNITHTWDGDLVVKLLHGATTVVLFNRHGSSGDNMTGTIFDDNASTSITSGSAPYAGSYIPDELLAAFNGLDNSTGDWILNVSDNAGSDYGILVDWYIDLTITNPTPMVFTSATTTQNTSFVYAGDPNAQVIGMQVVMAGSLTPLTLTQFTVNANGSTSVSDITNAKIFYTGSSSTFATINQFGTTIASPMISNFLINGSQVLNAGTNYFWLTYDVPVSAVLNNVIDAECTSLIIGGISHVLTITAPTGNRIIKVPLSGTKTVGVGMTYTTLTAAINDLNTLGVGAGGVTFNVTSGATFTEDLPLITATGAADRPIIFQKSSTTAAVLKPTGTSGTSDAGIAINGGDYITFDGINVTIATGSAVEYGYYLYGTATNGAQHNTIKNCSITLNAANTNSKAIYSTSAASSSGGTNSYNHYYNISVTNAYSGVCLNGSSTSGMEDIGNEIGVISGTNSISTLGLTTATTSVYGVFAYNQINAKVFSTNIITCQSSTGSIYGIYLSGANSTADIYSNQIRTLTASSSGYLYGIYVASGTTVNIYSNTVRGCTTATGSASGIYIYGGTTNNIYRNTIYDLSATGTGSYYAYGINLQGGSTNNVFNNMIRTVSAVASSGAPGAVGIYANSGTTDNIYYNTIMLNETGTVASIYSAALLASSTPTTIDIRNNIFVNNSTAGTGATGQVCAFRRSTTAFTNISSTTNNNLYYAGSADAVHLLFYDGTNSAQTLAQYKSLISTKDQLAVTENPPFISATNLKISTTIPTQIESGGSSITTPIAITEDFEGTIRSLTTPDIGADEGTFTILDLMPPAISYTVLTNTSSTSNRILSNVIIFDGSGLNISVGTKPRIYFKKSTDANVFGANNSSANGWKWAETSDGASPFSFTMNYSLLQSFPAGGEIIQYFVVAQDNATTPNVGANPSVGFAATSVAAITSAPTTPNSFVLIASISGIKTIGSGGNYPTITSALAILNAGELVGSVEYRLLDTAYTTNETFPLTINAVVGMSPTNTVTIKPASGVTGIILGGSSTTAIWKFDGATYVTIDGSNNGTTSKDLNIGNISTTAPAISFAGVSANNTIKNCSIGADNTSTSNGIININTTGAGNNNSILACDIGAVQATSAIGIYMGGTFTGSQTIQDCSINGMTSYGVYLYNSSSNGVLIQNNEIRNFGLYGVYLYYGHAPVVSKCDIYSTSVSSSSLIGIRFDTTPGAVIKKCKIHDLLCSATGTIVGIQAYGGSSDTEKYQVYNNEVYLETGAATTTGIVTGIDYYGYTSNSCDVYFNSVYIGGSNATGGTSYAFLKRVGVTTLNVQDNVFMNARSNGTGTGKHYAIGYTSTSTTTLNLNRNDYYATGTGGVLGVWSSTDCSTISAWITASSQDANSLTSNPLYTFGTNYLRPYTSSSVFGAGTFVEGITDDILGGTRSGSTPSIGAYETGVAGGTLTVPANISIRLDGSTVDITWDVVPFATGYKVYWSINPYGTTWTLLGSPTINDYIDTNSTPGLRFYKVTATQ